jgi:hypothetical protein
MQTERRLITETDQANRSSRRSNGLARSRKLLANQEQGRIQMQQSNRRAQQMFNTATAKRSAQATIKMLNLVKISQVQNDNLLPLPPSRRERNHTNSGPLGAGNISPHAGGKKSKKKRTSLNKKPKRASSKKKPKRKQ